MYTASDLRKGLKVEIDGDPYIITDFNFTKPGKGQAIYACKMKNMITGATLTKSYRSVEKVGKPQLSEKKFEFSYLDVNGYVFMDEDYEQVTISAEFLGQNRYFLNEGMQVDVLFFNDRAVDITLPNFVEKEIIYTEPGAKGNTATNVMKPGKIEGDFELQIPLFVNQGDIVKIDTRTGTYADRVSKA
ncbi:MAG: elongation factor P [Verrucomicrobia bacterium]|nr:elongation factor P [Verrucomicrobiota bacterium]